MGGKLKLNVNETFNTNARFETAHLEYPEEGNIEKIEYVLLKENNSSDFDVGTKVKLDRFVHVSLGKRSHGMYDLAWNTDLARKLTDEELETGYIPEANKLHCAKADPSVCYVKPATLYDSTYGVWQRFGIKAPENAPVLPETLPQVRAEPKKPRFLAKQEALANYERELAEYKQEVAAYTQAIKPYLDWVEQNKESFNALNQAITQNNQQYKGKLRNRWLMTSKETKVFKTTVTESQPGQILVGGDIELNDNQLVNDKSTLISGGVIIGSGVQNLDEKGIKETQFIGDGQYYNPRWRGRVKGWRAYHNDFANITRRENTTFDLGVYQMLENTNPNIVTPQNSTLKNNVNITELGNATTQFKPVQISRIVVHANGKEASASEIRSVSVDTRLPNTSIYRVNPGPENNILIETDPEFTQKNKWLSSDYMFNALRVEPNSVQKRLGDGFYEQRLVREQINRLTGRQFVGANTDFEAQYKALMEAGKTFAEKFNLRLGLALSPEQVAQLTSDIVWFETQSVRLPNGKTESVLVPKVYALVQKGDIDGRGTLISAEKATINAGEFINQGIFAARTIATLNSDNLNNSGTISAGRLFSDVRGDVENTGSLIADDALLINAKGNFTHRATTQTTEVDLAGYQRKETNLDRKALLHVKNANGTLRLSAENIDVQGADIINDGQGGIYLAAKNNVTFGTVGIGFDEQVGNGDHSRHEKSDDVVISKVKGSGEVVISAKNIYTEGADFEVGKRLALQAENDVVLASATRRNDFEEHHDNKSGSAIARRQHTTHDTQQQIHKQGTVLSGTTVEVEAGHDVKGKNLQVIAEGDIDVVGDNNVSLTADTHYNKQAHLDRKVTKGVFNGGETGITIGKKSITQENDAEGWIQSDARSTLASVNGNITVKAKKGVSDVAGSDLVVKKSDLEDEKRSITISGQKGINLGAGVDKQQQHERIEQKQSGLTIEFKSALTDAAMAGYQAVKRAKTSSDPRLAKVNALKAANEAYEASKEISKISEVLDKLNEMNTTQAMANTDMKIAVSVGSSRSVSETNSRQVSHQGSQLEGSEVNLYAMEGDINIVGSKISAQAGEFSGKNVNILNETDNEQTRSDNKSTGWKVGVFVGKSGSAKGFGVEGSANLAKGYSNADSQKQVMSDISVSHLVIRAENDTTIKGAKVKSDDLTLNTHNLQVKSVQDSERYASKQMQASAAGSIAYGSGGSAQASASLNKAKVDYAQVNEQSGLFIGSRSNITVAGNTHLKGGVITTEGSKENNHFTTGTLTTEAVENHSELKTESVSTGYSTDGSAMMTAGQTALAMLSGNMHEKEHSLTQAAVGSQMTVVISDSAAQQQKTGKTAEAALQSLNRDVANANQKVGKQDLAKVQASQEAAQILGEIGAKRIGDIAQAQNWAEGSPEKIAMHGLLGFLTAKVGGGNGLSGALAGAGGEWVNSQVAEYLRENTELTLAPRQAIQQLTAAGFGAAVGQAVKNDGNSANARLGAQVALNAELNNRQLHPDEIERIEKLANGDKEKARRLTIAACALVHCSAQIPSDSEEYAEAYAKEKALEELGNQAEFAEERTLLANQMGDIDFTDSFGSGRNRKLFDYNKTQSLIDKADAWDSKYGVSARLAGSVQTAFGAASLGSGVGLCETGLGCVAGTAVAAYGADHVLSGARTIWDGKAYPTYGAQGLSYLTGMNADTAELVYGLPLGMEANKVGSTALKGAKTAGDNLVYQVGENLSRGTTNKLGEQYHYLGNGTFAFNQSTKIVNTGITDKVTGNAIYQRLDENGKVYNSYFMISRDGTQIRVNKPDNLKVVSQSTIPTEGYNRAYLRKDTREKIFSGYKYLPNGNYLDVISQQTVKGPIDIGHVYGWEHRRLSLAATENKMSQAEFNDYVNEKPELFKLENRSENRAHKNEKPGTDDIKDIIDDMQKFLATGE